MKRALPALAALALPGLAAAAATFPMSLGQTVELQLGANQFSNAIVIDVPAGTAKLRVRAVAADSQQDIDLLVRDGSPFPDTNFDGTPVDPGYLFEHAGHYAAGSLGDEELLLADTGGAPLRSGPLHVALINFAGAGATVRVTAEAMPESFYYPITPVFDDTRSGCDVSGWNDATAATPIRGNTGTTLGQQRRNALNEAARLLSEELRPNAPIRIQACWESDLEFGPQGGVLAHAGPYFEVLADAGASRSLNFLDDRFVVYAVAAASNQAGTGLCHYLGGGCANPYADVFAGFNLKVDQAENAAQHFDYGFDQAGSSGASFITTSMHEITHGLGFLGNLDLQATLEGQNGVETPNPDYGEQSTFSNTGLRYDDAYGRHAQTVAGLPRVGIPLLDLSVEERLVALTSIGNLRFGGPLTIASSQNPNLTNIPPYNTVRLHAPSTMTPGSTYSHVGTENHSPQPQLMSASIHPSAPRTLGLAREILGDAGWDAADASAEAINPVESQYFDVSRNGHGFEIRKIAGVTAANGDPLYFVTLYTYGEDGTPEFYTAAGTIINGVFAPSRDASSGDSMIRSVYLGADHSPQTRADTDPGFEGQLRIDFVDAERHPVCRDGAAGRNPSLPQAVMSWQVNATEQQWCVQSLFDPAVTATTDFSNQWFQPADSGWGLSIASFPGNGSDGLAMEIYYPDATGYGRWGLVYTDHYVPGEPIAVMSASGYCRTCATQDLEFTQVGTLSIDLRDPAEGASSVSFDITYPGVEGGRFVRDGVAIIPVGTPNY